MLMPTPTNKRSWHDQVKPKELIRTLEAVDKYVHGLIDRAVLDGDREVAVGGTPQWDLERCAEVQRSADAAPRRTTRA